MSEKEKMLQGELYNCANDTTLFNERCRAKDLCYEFNQLKPSAYDKRNEIIKQLFS